LWTKIRREKPLKTPVKKRLVRSVRVAVRAAGISSGAALEKRPFVRRAPPPA